MAVVVHSVNPYLALLNHGELNSRYTFDGTTMYATYAAWDTLGDYDTYGEVTFMADGAQDDVVDLPPPLTEIGRVGVNYHDGAIWNYRLTDNSPIQDTDACMGNGTRYGEIPQIVIPDTDDFELNVDAIYDGSAASSILGGGSDTWITFGAAGNVYFSLEGTAALSLTMASIPAVGQHIRLRVTKISNQIRAYVDDVEATGSDSRITAFTFDKIGADTLGEKQFLSGTSHQNVEIKNLTTGERWFFPLDEGSGTVINNTDPITGGPGTEGAWTPDVDWQNIPNNTRYYPMNDGAKENGIFRCFDGTGKRVPAYDATIVNYNEDNWS